MDFNSILSILDKMFLTSLGVEKTNEILVQFMNSSVDSGHISITTANDYLEMYGCQIAIVCWGCVGNQPNQLAHMDPGGCLYNLE
jgi:hypothetical protein